MGAYWLEAVEEARRLWAQRPDEVLIEFDHGGREWLAARFPGGWQLMERTPVIVVRHTVHERR